MTNPVPRPARVSTAGSWFGLGVCAWGALIACVAASVMTAVLSVPAIVEWFWELARQRSGDTELHPRVPEALNLALEGAQILRPYAVTMGVSGIAIGGLLFLAGFGLARGSDLARRATRLLLVLAMLNTAIDAAWKLVLVVTKVGPWFQRFAEPVNELGRLGPNRAPVFPEWLDPGGIADVASGVVTTLFTLAIGGTLIWLAGRPFARDWCAARSGRSPIASPGSPG